ncbi:winged helix family transcriptional regulator [Shimia aestuarii]|uniref:Tetratricopeptide repeat-containing protein n=1 Tax=Shimia aestuarii TaxID=254406 RepID=A0A1I4MDR2_9RHOB|nr:winged helix family transcriptional regulator [Shimia aestuarii]SFM01339.1 hypothetical protein SAMN04488042_10326 [Shimia aestuarii]
MSPENEKSIRIALEDILKSPQLSGSARLQGFLTYVVEQSLQGHPEEIVGKIIAQDVYGRQPADGSDNIVRVDARRLRRALSDYYATHGGNDAVVIHIDSGGYVPRFEFREGGKETQKLAKSRLAQFRIPIASISLFAVALLVWSVGRGIDFPPSPDSADINVQERAVQERKALAEKSMATLQASNMAAKASEMLFPIADVELQTAALKLFEEAIRIDPAYAGGYAGAAHSLSTLAILAPDLEQREEKLKAASLMSGAAVDLDPTDGWGISSQAWLAFASADFENAKTLSHRAYLLSEIDGRVLNFRALILLLTGSFAEAQKISAPDAPRRDAGSHQANLNIHGVASFHLGDYETAVSSFDSAIASGAPVSELTLLYMAASYQANAQTDEAQKLLAELSRTWPLFQPEVALSKFYASHEHVDAVLVHLMAAGWPKDQ